jgi:cytochrome c oxidase cbb3-type subunit III
MRTIVLALFPFLLLAQDPVDVARAKETSAHADAGKRVFQQNCSFCHGPTGRGASGPDLLRSSLVSHDENGSLIGPVVQNGRPDKGMPSFTLSDEEVRNISDYLHAETKLVRGAYETSVSDYPVEKLLVGDRTKGHAYFEAHCSKCHSVSGDLAHVAGRYNAFDLQSRIAFPSGKKPEVSATDAAGKTYSGEETYEDEFLVSLRDKTGVVRTFRRDKAQIKIDDPLAEHVRLLHTYTDADIHNLFAYLETLK